MIIEKVDKATFKVDLHFKVNFLSLESRTVIYLTIKFCLLIYVFKEILIWLI